MRGIRVGVSVSSAIHDGTASLWASGVNQNAVFLTQLLQALPQVAWAGMLTYPDAKSSPLATLFGLPSHGLREGVSDIDVLIELGVRAGREEMEAFRDRGGKLVSYMAGNAMVMNFEAVANNARYGEVLDHPGFDAVWITPQHWHMNRSYALLTRSTNVQKAPHIWHPCVLDVLAKHFAVKFDWQPPAPGTGWRIGIFEPNVNVLKTFHLPLLVCEQAFRRQPERIARVLMFGAAQLSANVHFKEMCGTLDLSRAGKLFAEGRHPLVQALGTHVDAVVTHQWENALNYLYWDTLSGGFPLIHNSPEISGAGYYYPAFDPVRGGEVLNSALASHGEHIQDFRARAKVAIAKFRTDNDNVRARYAALLEQVTA